MRQLVPAVLLLCCSGLAQSPTSAAQRFFQDGEKAIEEARYADAEHAYQQLSALDPTSGEVHAKLGMILFQEGKYEQALPELHRALTLKPSLAEASTLQAMSLSELGRFKEAIPGLEKGFRRSVSPDLRRSAGLQLQRAYTGLQADDKAVEVALELTRLYPEDPEILYQTGRIFGNYAYLTMMKLSKAPASSVWRHQAAGEAFESQGSFDLAAVEYRNVLAIDPNRPGIHYRLGRVLLAQSRRPEAGPGSIQQAASEFEKELQRDPTNGNAAYELGEIHRKAERFDQARTYFEISVKADPDFVEAQLGLGRTLISLKDPVSAVVHLQRAVSLNPQDEVAYYQLAKANGAVGDHDAQQKALAQYQRLRAQKAAHETSEVAVPREITKQELDSNTER